LLCCRHPPPPDILLLPWPAAVYRAFEQSDSSPQSSAQKRGDATVAGRGVVTLWGGGSGDETEVIL
jgi:hypothetical protein